MHRLEREDFLRKRFISLWAILGFQAGFINSFGFLISDRFVSHVTGTSSQVGFAMSIKQWTGAAELVLIPVFFILGSFLNGALTVARIDKGKKPHFEKIMLAFPLIIALLLMLLEAGIFGSYENSIWSFGKFVLVYVLSFVCGMQNGCFATMTKGQIRTTHLTGISTDLGTDLARSFFGNLDEKERSLVNKTNICRISTFAAFAVGAVVSVFATKYLHYTALCIPIVTSLTVYVSVMYFNQSVTETLNSHSDQKDLILNKIKLTSLEERVEVSLEEEFLAPSSIEKPNGQSPQL